MRDSARHASCDLDRVAGWAVTGLVVVTIGVAHGANDDAILARILPGLRGGRPAIAVAYAAVMAGISAAAWRAPETARRILTLLTWYHFGSGDVAFARAAGSNNSSYLEPFIRGAIPLCGRGSKHSALLGGVAAVSAIAHLRRGDFAGALDIAVPAVVMATRPFPFAFAAYFGFWHAPRYIALVLARFNCPTAPCPVFQIAGPLLDDDDFA